MNPYIADILAQPEALRRAVDAFSPESLAPVRTALARGDYDRILITGMGASLNAAYPAVLALGSGPLPVQLVNSAELLHYLKGQITERTLLWMNSQSGRSAELVYLLDTAQQVSPACVVACVNDSGSPLAAGADVCVPIHAGPENTVSTKTHLNTLAVNLMAACVLTGSDLDPLMQDLLSAADSIEAYLDDMEDRVSQLDRVLGDFSALILVGRGASMGAVWNGALITKESAKYPLEGLNAAEFRHGPLELAAPGFTALVLAGDQTAGLNRKLAQDINRHGGRAVWIDTSTDTDLETFLMPHTEGAVRPLGEILPLQLLTLVLAARNGVTAGQFRNVEKVTAAE